MQQQQNENAARVQNKQNWPQNNQDQPQSGQDWPQYMQAWPRNSQTKQIKCNLMWLMWLEHSFF